MTAPDAAARSRIPAPLVAAFLTLLAVALLLARAVAACGGRFAFALDDPYIHLALARGIAHGHYGINPGEASAPSSSALWPLLLAPLTASPWPVAATLALCALAAAATAALMAEVSRRAFPRLSGNPLAAGLLGTACALWAGLPALVLTGMEHSLQALLAVAGLVALLRVDRGDRAPWWMVPALAAGPLVRYESFALTVPAAAALWRLGHRRDAALAVGVPALLLGAFSAALRAQGLGWLPSSVEAKLLDAQPWSLARFLSPEVLWFLLPVAVLLLPRCRSEGGVAAHVALACAALHLAFGRFGHLGRYEAYASAVVAAAALWAARGVLGELRAPRRIALAAGGVALFALSPSFAAMRGAGRNCAAVHGQQEQTARFVRDFWKAPVAVNDLGMVSWSGGQPVLDLWGLGSREALRLRARGALGDHLDALCRRSGVRLAVVYRAWFPSVPPSWTLVAHTVLRIQGANYAPEVLFYALDAESAAAVARLFPRFAAGLPDSAEGELLSVRPASASAPSRRPPPPSARRGTSAG